ncbi:MAG: flagellar basal body-associated FliL family protein [Rhodocyclaceae bacterium]|nr:flagellar basal body-associated FliL family protein [Rhodocyclaceae bacterium]
MKTFKPLLIWIGLATLTLCAGAVSASEGGGHGGGGGGSPGSLPLEALVINLKGDHYLQIKPILKLADPADTDVVKAWIPLLRHELIKYIIGREPGEATSPQFMKVFSGETTDLFNKALRGKYVKDVIFDNWLVQ